MLNEYYGCLNLNVHNLRWVGFIIVINWLLGNLQNSLHRWSLSCYW